MNIDIRPVRNGDQAEWLRMRASLWPNGAHSEHTDKITAFLSKGSFRWSESLLAVAVFVAARPSGGLCGFLEASIHPYAEGCESRPVGYVEGWFVDPDLQRRGIGKALMAAAEQWTAAHGCQEMASDTHLKNTVSRSAHKALGFEESERLVHFRKRLVEAGGDAAEPGFATHRLRLLEVVGPFAVCKLPTGLSLPLWATTGDLFSVTRTADELSVVCRNEAVPEGVVCERDWRCLRVAGAMPFTLVGVLAALTTPLAKAGASIFAVSTFDTDYLFIKAGDWEKAMAALRVAGHVVEAGCGPSNESTGFA
jgi:aminoglycoside 6'-N-acetyltransferase I